MSTLRERDHRRSLESAAAAGRKSATLRAAQQPSPWT
jgi:hypothetical protein